MISLVVFSKDRAMQLESLLRSISDNVRGIDCVHVLFKTTSRLHADAYDKLIYTIDTPRDFRLLFYPEAKDDTPGSLLEMALEDGEPDHIGFAVDDMMFYAPSDYAFAAKEIEYHLGFVWSWRLGATSDHALWCENSHWLGPALTSDRDYGYLFHTDGSLYRIKDYLRILKRCLPQWNTGPFIPNDLEAVVAARRSEWAPLVGPHLGPLEPTCITWQLNRVQTRYGSPSAEIPETSLDALGEAFLEGKRVDNSLFYDLPGKWLAARFNPPGARPTHVYACEEASKFYAEKIR